MATRSSLSQVLKDLRAGPTTASPPTAQQVAVASEKYPRQFEGVMRKLFSAMSSEVLRFPRRNVIDRWLQFSNAWREEVSNDYAKYYLGSLDAYHHATRSGLRELDWNSVKCARATAKKLTDSMPAAHTIEGLAWRVLLGQIGSIYSREEAARTFSEVRGHHRVNLVPEFYRDTGALTYYSEVEVQRRRQDLPTLSMMRNWETGGPAASAQALVISADPSFFRIYGPMILHNAQQLPSVDFVVLLCASAQQADRLWKSAETYLTGLTALNLQPAPSNVRVVAVDTPEWVYNETTFYACARFLAMPELLEEYENIYVVDADLFMLRDPRPFMEKVAHMAFGAPRTEGSLGVSPWRRFMAGNVVVNRQYVGSVCMERFQDYLSVGLTEGASWMLDQNAITYAVEAAEAYKPITARPLSVGNFMSQWETNFRNQSNG